MLLLGFAISSSACSATFTDPRVPAGETKSTWQSYFVYGAVGSAQVDVRDYCATNRAHEVHLGADFLTVGVSIITLGIYTPRKVTVTCAKETKAP